MTVPSRYVQTIPDGRVLPELEFWQMNMMIEGFMLNMNTVSGMLGETARPVVGVNGEDYVGTAILSERLLVNDKRFSVFLRCTTSRWSR